MLNGKLHSKDRIERFLGGAKHSLKILELEGSFLGPIDSIGGDCFRLKRSEASVLKA